MTIAAMTERIAEASPRFKARIAGVFYLFAVLTGASGLLLAGPRLFAYGDAGNFIATAR